MRTGTSYSSVPVLWNIRDERGKYIGDVHLHGKRFEARGSSFLGTCATLQGAARRLLRDHARQEQAVAPAGFSTNPAPNPRAG
jgi:hypothetical protein